MAVGGGSRVALLDKPPVCSQERQRDAVPDSCQYLGENTSVIVNLPCQRGKSLESPGARHWLTPLHVSEGVIQSLIKGELTRKDPRPHVNRTILWDGDLDGTEEGEGES